MGQGAYRDGQGVARAALDGEQRRLEARAASIAAFRRSKDMPPKLAVELAMLEASLAKVDGGVEPAHKEELLAQYEEAIEAAIAIEAGSAEFPRARRLRGIIATALVMLLVLGTVASLRTQSRRRVSDAFAWIPSPGRHEAVEIDAPAGMTCDRACEDYGRCTEVQPGVCAATEDDDCRHSYGCRARGRCFAVEGRCVARRDEDCAASKGCREWGFCSLSDTGFCAALSDADCQRSNACRVRESCRPWQGRCVD